MKSVRIPLDLENRCQLPLKCVCCGTAGELENSEETLKASNPLQLVSVLPWVFVGPALKTAPVSFFLALVLSVGLFAVLSTRIRVSVPRCKECLKQKSVRRRHTAVLFFLGLLAVLSSSLLGYEAMLPFGFFITFAAIFYAALAARRYSVRLSRLHGKDAVLLMPTDTTEG